MLKAVCLFAAISGTAQAGEPVEFRLPKMRVAPVVDGRIGADEWKDAVGGFGFCVYPGEVAGPVPISFLVGRTDDRLFLAARRAVGPAGVGVPVAERKRGWGGGVRRQL